LYSSNKYTIDSENKSAIFYKMFTSLLYVTNKYLNTFVFAVYCSTFLYLLGWCVEPDTIARNHALHEQRGGGRQDRHKHCQFIFVGKKFKERGGHDNRGQ
jgi:hypothetical protein